MLELCDFLLLFVELKKCLHPGLSVRGWFAILTPTEVGGVAQLGARLNGIQKVRGSNPLASTQLCQFPLSIMDETAQELLRLTQRLLDAIVASDLAAYQELSDPSLTSFEPEALGQLVIGLPFHEFYFQRGGANALTTICSPHVRVLGDVAVVSYTRLVQRRETGGTLVTVGSEETRIWHRQASQWRQVHFHRSALGTWRPRADQ